MCPKKSHVFCYSDTYFGAVIIENKGIWLTNQGL